MGVCGHRWRSVVAHRWTSVEVGGCTGHLECLRPYRPSSRCWPWLAQDIVGLRRLLQAQTGGSAESMALAKCVSKSVPLSWDRSLNPPVLGVGRCFKATRPKLLVIVTSSSCDALPFWRVFRPRGRRKGVAARPTKCVQHYVGTHILVRCVMRLCRCSLCCDNMPSFQKIAFSQFLT